MEILKRPALGLVLLLALAAKAPAGTVTLVAVGDLRLDGPIGRIADRDGLRAPFEGVADWLDGDLLFGNLEEPITKRGTAVQKKFTFRAPPSRLKILKEAGFDLLSLANNHVMDYGAAGLTDTLSSLKAAGFIFTGAGPDALMARKPVFVKSNGLRIGLIALTTTLPKSAWARRRRPGVAYANFDRVTQWVAAAKAKCDVLLVSFHGGTELDIMPNQVQRDFAALAVAGGADAILGHHTHVVQPVEISSGALILHSLGNFLFVSPTRGTERSVIARLTLSPGRVDAELVPVHINGGKLRPATGDDHQIVSAVLNAFDAVSEYPGRVQIYPDELIK